MTERHFAAWVKEFTTEYKKGTHEVKWVKVVLQFPLGDSRIKELQAMLSEHMDSDPRPAATLVLSEKARR